MPFRGFEGPAGTGKTHELVGAVRERMMAGRAAHERVLALTFMHGSRRRLDERFSLIDELRSRANCMTLDSFAHHLVRRWGPLAPQLPQGADFDAVCDACGELLERPEVARWVGSSYPVIAVDEAQELKPCRLRIIRALENHVEVLVAADEFQCLDEHVDTGPFIEWFATGEVQQLTQVRRTGRAGLLAAGVALRGAGAPADGPGLRFVHKFPAQTPFSIGHVLNNAQGSTAVLVAPGGKGWADDLIPRLTQGFQSQAGQAVFPVRIGWEVSTSDEVDGILNAVCPADSAAAIATSAALLELPVLPAWARQAATSIDRVRRNAGRVSWSRQDLRDLFERKANADRAYGHTKVRGVPVMTIHAAKNRQFRNVVVLWPPGVPGSPDHKRRLLYNAVTRAEHQCHVFVRTQATLQSVPFA
jgi:hypothetical protein